MLSVIRIYTKHAMATSADYTDLSRSTAERRDFFAGTLSRASKQSMIDFQQSKQVINDSFPAEQASNQ